MVICFSDKDAQELQRGKRNLFNKLCWNDWVSVWGKTELTTQYTNINSSWFIEQNEKAKIKPQNIYNKT